jgi:hypothetical protein
MSSSKASTPVNPGSLASPHSNASSTNSASTFTIPGVFDAVYYNTPDIHSVFVHAVSSSADEEGFQAIICLHPSPDRPAHLGLPVLPNYENKAFLQVAPENHSFVLQSQTQRNYGMQVTVTEYLILLQFVGHEWPRLKSKLDSQLITMREGTDPIYITGYLMFYNHGSSHFQVSLSSRLVFKASVESRDPEHKIKAWLERRSLSDGNSPDNGFQEMVLPMNALTTLGHDTQGIKSLVDHMANYKSRSRKRSKTVIT